MKKLSVLFSLILFLSSNLILNADDKDGKKDIHKFKMLYNIENTSVKNQSNSGTCWSFSATSFLESELIRIGFGNHDISEMYFVRKNYPQKAERYMRYHGNFNFGPGGQAHDVTNVVKEFGMVPEEFYHGIDYYGEDNHNHSELDAVLKAILDATLKSKSPKTTNAWDEAVGAVLDVYLGKVPNEFEYKGKKYTPQSFAKASGFNPDDYIEFTSYTNYPFNQKVMLEVPDNWSFDLYYNVELNDLMKIMDNALATGYSIEWDGDVSKDNFYRKKGYAVIPKNNEMDPDDVEEPEEEKVITQEIRQEAFDNHDVTDDHLMHIVGLAENQNGTKFYYTKNSWGTKTGGKEMKYDGYWYMSDSYVRLKTIAFMVHKDAVPKEIRERLGF